MSPERRYGAQRPSQGTSKKKLVELDEATADALVSFSQTMGLSANSVVNAGIVNLIATTSSCTSGQQLMDTYVATRSVVADQWASTVAKLSGDPGPKEES